MKRFMLKFSLFLAVIFCVLFGIFMIAYRVIPTYPSNAYMKIFNVKFRQLQETPGPRIVLLGGSAAAFGLDNSLLAELTGYNVVNMGVHAGLGASIYLDAALDYARPEDVMVIAFEYDIPFPQGDFGLAVNGMREEELVKYMANGRWNFFSRCWLPYTLYKCNTWIRHIGGKKREYDSDSPYSLLSFDDAAQMIFPRPAGVIDADRFRERNPPFTLYANSEMLDAINTFGVMLEKKGATALFSFPPTWGDALTNSKEDIASVQREFESRLHIPVISKISDYLFAENLMYDTRYHCNDLGEKARTRLLARDINRFLRRE